MPLLPPISPSTHLLPTMSGSNPATCASTDNFTAIMKAAGKEYQRVTEQDLDAHPFAAQLDTCRGPETVSKLLRTQALAFSKFRQSHEKLMGWLDPTVHVLFMVSVTLSDGIGMVSSSFIFLMSLLRRLFLSHSSLRERSSLASQFFSG